MLFSMRKLLSMMALFDFNPNKHDHSNVNVKTLAWCWPRLAPYYWPLPHLPPSRTQMCPSGPQIELATCLYKVLTHFPPCCLGGGGRDPSWWRHIGRHWSTTNWKQFQMPSIWLMNCSPCSIIWFTLGQIDFWYLWQNTSLKKISLCSMNRKQDWKGFQS